MQMARLLRISGAARGAAPQAEALADRPEPPLPLGAETTNGDGFGIGWYGVGDTPGVFHSIEPAWNDRNLKDLARPPRLAARLRPHPRLDRRRDPADQLPPLPARNWLWMHNGFIGEFATVKRDLALAVDPCSTPRSRAPPTPRSSSTSRSPSVSRTTLQRPSSARGGFIEATGRAHGVEHPIQMTVATTDGSSIWAFRYSSEGQSRSLFFSTAVDALRAQYPDNPILHELSARGAAGRLRAARRPRRRVERGARVELRRRPGGPGRAAAVRAANEPRSRRGAPWAPARARPGARGRACRSRRTSSRCPRTASPRRRRDRRAR